MRNFLDALDLIKIEEYVYLNSLSGGKASSSAIYVNNKNEKIVIKFLISPRNELELSRFKDEAETLELISKAQLHLDEDSYVPLLKIKFTKNDLFPIYYFGMEYIEGITLTAYISTNPLPWSWEKSTEFLLFLSQCLYNLNLGNFVHRDLHPGNILYMKKGEVFYDKDSKMFKYNTGLKIIDFGCSRSVFRDLYLPQMDDKYRLVGALTSLSPELLLDPTKVDNKHDSFAIGTMYYRFLTGFYPIEIHNFGDICNAFNDENALMQKIDNLDLPFPIKLLLKKSLSFNQIERFSINEIRDSCLDILHSDLMKLSESSVEEYFNNRASLVECLRCHQIISFRGNRCTNCGEIFSGMDNIIDILNYSIS